MGCYTNLLSNRNQLSAVTSKQTVDITDARGRFLNLSNSFQSIASLTEGLDLLLEPLPRFRYRIFYG
jgi:hypothetical protein